ncbi:MAG: secondary thiamine-phosphate synthase enzyme YjbQ [Kiritimatiellia bacterium]
MKTLNIHTKSHACMVNITAAVQEAVEELKIKDGTVTVFSPHTTCGLTINENADPDVVHDFSEQLELTVPWRQPFYRHVEGNSAAHIKASIMGFDITVIIEDGRMQLGTWQGIFLCEFDGPRTRNVFVR